ncbi:N-acetylglucosamine-1-phosphotransferase subunits alpha/beta isoform X2 [Centruroides vittatus]|uniref:N-acetylglucosamine-1-phosphotransferase subunits alpha/beta isoform X2 n=1 Tax=Centruroides vittatus TaxID=120091 RepID=UPI00351072F7
MSKSLLCKLLQKRTYDILSQKRYLVLCFVGFVLLSVSAFRFGETVLEWSKEKYAAVFNSFSDNIAGRSFQNMLCQYVPIDVVYTWVNGTDPQLIAQLMQIKQKYDVELNQSSFEHCTFSYCVTSHMALVEPALSKSISLSDLEEADEALGNVSRIFVVNSVIKDVTNNITVLVFSDFESAQNAIKKQYFTINGHNHTIQTAYITEDWMAQNTVLLNDVIMMTGVHSRYNEVDVLSKLPKTITKHIQKIYLYKEKSLAVVTVMNKEAQDKVLQFEHNITIDGKSVKLSAANLVVQFPTGNEDISSSRFADNEELRYSLRSLEKHAPWIHHVYIVTNGQIPHWLNLDNPRISIITHEEIFPNKSHLPTFSSPAIETHLHRIPGLSKKFLYLNDDVMFGKDVWPEDFYTHTKGQKIYLSWPVPDCAEGCPPAWIRDGYCDKPCNNSECQWDGGDCTGDKVQIAYPHHFGHDNSFRYGTGFLDDSDKALCNQNCVNAWLADRYCDQACNVYTCAFDAGDCGTSNYHHLFGIMLMNEKTHYIVPKGEIFVYFNLSNLLSDNETISEGNYEHSPVVRVMAISLKYQVLTVVLYPNYNTTNLTVTIKGERLQKAFQFTFQFEVNTYPLIIKKEKEETLSTTMKTKSFTVEEFSPELRQPKILHISEVVPDLIINNVNTSDLPSDISENIKALEKSLSEGLITEKGFQRKKQLLLMKFSEKNRVNQTNSVGLQNESQKFKQKSTQVRKEKEKLISFFNNKHKEKIYQKLNNTKTLRQLKGLVQPESVIFHNGKFPWEKQNTFSKLQKLLDQKRSSDRYNVKSVKRRKLLDTFGDSLRHVNKLYNEAFGFETRKVPAHIAHFIDVDVMQRVQEKFYDQFDITSSHRMRSSTDMQFAFSYYYYLMNEMKTVEMDEIFDEFDTDHSGLDLVG